jgi:hypothetical protein
LGWGKRRCDNWPREPVFILKAPENHKAFKNFYREVEEVEEVE